MIESLWTTQHGFFRGSGDEVQKVSVQEKIIWNHLWERRFLVPDPRVFPNLCLSRTGSPVISHTRFERYTHYYIFTLDPQKHLWKGGPRWWAQQACPLAQWFNGCTLFLWCEELHRICQRVQDKVNVSKLSRQFYLCCYWTWLLWLLCE